MKRTFVYPRLTTRTMQNVLHPLALPGPGKPRSACVASAILMLLLGSASPAASAVASEPVRELGPWVESTYPFFSSVFDAREAGLGSPDDNLTPRGLILPLGQDQWVCFDLDLLRVAAIWEGNGVTPVALAPGSYHDPNRKTPPGQRRLPRPDGVVWLANGIYPGWQRGAVVSLEDPREPAPTAAEVGRGPLPAEMGRFESVRLMANGVVLHYRVGTTAVREYITAETRPAGIWVQRSFEVGTGTEPLLLVIGSKGVRGVTNVNVAARREHDGRSVADLMPHPDAWIVRIDPREHPILFSVGLARSDGLAAPRAPKFVIPSNPSRWPEVIRTTIKPAAANAAVVVDDIELPVRNPWARDIRVSDIQFRQDGTGVAVTIDGDVWLVRGLHEPDGVIRWRRFASGLHEPMTLAVRDEEIFVFDRNGVWRLRDETGDDEADVHELFSNAFAQTADMREFPNTIRLAPGGGFVIAKGGQEATTLGKHNGSVLKISADGTRAEVLGYGFRQPNIGVNRRTGLVTASDQQGHYVPSTPLHIVRDRQFYGFLSGLLPREQYPAPIADPLTWIPHTINPSGLSQVWLHDARMGSLSEGLVHISFNRPELFRVLLNERGSRLQAAVVSMTNAFDFPPLNGSVNPADGQLYLAGFQVFGWGTTATKQSGLARVRYTGEPLYSPNELVPMDKGLLVRFDVPLDRASAENPDNFVVASWHYQRTYKYGSPQFRQDGTPGTDPLPVSNAYLSSDRRSVFLAISGMQPVMQMQLQWAMMSDDGVEMRDVASFTPYDLVPFDPQAEGFGELVVEMSRKTPAAAAPEVLVTAEQGALIARDMGCLACHSPTDPSRNTPGPSWLGLYLRERRLSDQQVVTADEHYLRESILNPSARTPAGYANGEFAMPSYAGVLSDAQIESLILYIKTLRGSDRLQETP